MIMLPIFSNIFQVYAMSNLHDISWGNRPASTGMETFTSKKVSQEKIKSDYMVFRTNFLFLWVCCNLGFYFGIMAMLNQNAKDGHLNSEIDYLSGYAIFIASLVLFKSFFAFFYILSWKADFACSLRYKETTNLDMQQNYDEIKKTRRASSCADNPPARLTTKSLQQSATLLIDTNSD